jgi:hypothetical protein
LDGKIASDEGNLLFFHSNAWMKMEPMGKGGVPWHAALMIIS